MIINSNLGLINLSKTKECIDRNTLTDKEWLRVCSAYLEYNYYINLKKGTKKAKMIIEMNNQIVVCI